MSNLLLLGVGSSSGSAPSGGFALLLENNDRFQLEDGSGVLLLE